MDGSIGDPGFSTLDSTDEQKPHHCLSGTLWYLQHNCVGDTIVYHKASNILFVLLVVFQVFSCVMNTLVPSAKSCSFCFFVTLWSHKKNLPHLPVCLYILMEELWDINIDILGKNYHRNCQYMYHGYAIGISSMTKGVIERKNNWKNSGCISKYIW